MSRLAVKNAYTKKLRYMYKIGRQKLSKVRCLYLYNIILTLARPINRKYTF